jgi:oxygen-independent coproporphyrinogen-3 oxidase
LHSFADFRTILEDARAVGFENLSADVMFGIPKQTVGSYLQTLESLCALAPTHISAYGLTVEEGTPYGRMGDRLCLPDEEETRRMYLEGIDLLSQNRYAQYEISNFCREGFPSGHNLKYWSCEEYLGFGPAAYSDFGGSRFGNSRDLDAYIKGEDITEEREEIGKEERKNEYVMLRMRLASGLSRADFEARFGEALDARFGAALQRYISLGLVRRTHDGYVFTPDGWYVSNTILSEILDFSEK